jgi:hypothetical protein
MGGDRRPKAGGKQAARPSGHRKLARLMKRAKGIVKSGVSDLGTNPKHLAGFGRDNSRR